MRLLRKGRKSMNKTERGELKIRREMPEDHEKVERLVREAFYNIYMPGCVEHYLVHIMRGHEDFIPELDLVAELYGEIIGSIMYTKAKLRDKAGNERDILTFGPVCISPKYQRRGYGKILMEYSFERAVELGYEAIVIFGSPANYVGRGFKSCKKYDVSTETGRFPAAMLVKELIAGALSGKGWIYCGSPVMEISEEDALRYDDSLEKMEKKHLSSQEEFYIMSRSYVE